MLRPARVVHVYVADPVGTVWTTHHHKRDSAVDEPGLQRIAHTRGGQKNPVDESSPHDPWIELLLFL
jgi:hypothetical protein